MQYALAHRLRDLASTHVKNAELDSIALDFPLT